MTDHKKAIVAIVQQVGRRHGQHRVFSDVMECAAIAISNAVDMRSHAKREERYLQIVGGYKPDEVKLLPAVLGHLGAMLEEGMRDALGEVYSDLELTNAEAGQFFTPYHVAKLMAEMTVGAGIKDEVERKGFITVQEPAVGAGGMVIALADAMLAAGVNYQQHMRVHGIDIDLRCVHMAYLQFSLLNIPAVVIHGNTLSAEEYSHWYTPAWILGGWAWKKQQPGAVVEADVVSPAEVVKTATGEQRSMF